ncbi:hypothetical protein QBC38DRAFT_95069 [Podospora fimiseda]|uniref:HhH-GPD domain-containing protein n=1 Tax=Podospora fimiseda TaxID=252190 RepID=A0AAN7BZP8_9PEZI|nr:hypothetical protein QBC38DRAFT_95069 [Podospora fimiseda]
MRTTRAAAKRATESIASSAANSPAPPQLAGNVILGTNSATPSLSEVDSPSPKSTIEVANSRDTTETLDESSTGPKHKRQTQAAPKRKRAPPVKKEWVLPHGMGAALGAPDEPVTSQSLPTATAQPEGQTSFASSIQQDGVAPLQKPKRARGTKKDQEQTQIGFRTTKPVASEKESIAVQDDNTADDSPETLKQEETSSETEKPPAKAQRVSRTRKVKISAKVNQNADSTHTNVQVKTEETTVEEKTLTTATEARKLLIFRNITFKSNVAVKHSDVGNILIDATRILDPNKRMIIKRGPENPYGLTPGFSPYPYRRVPTPEDCEEVHRILTETHADTASKLRASRPEVMPEASLEVAGCGEVPCVLDALLRTLISGNTLMARADAAIKRLGEHYGTRTTGTGAGSINWEKVRLSSHEELAEVIKTAGNGSIRSKHIKTIINMVYEENIERGNTDDSLSLDHMRYLTKDQAMAKFVQFPGIGIKTAACVSLFSLRLPCLAVDTHVHKFCGWLGWTPEKADPDNCYRHVDAKVPDHLKYGLHNLFIVHGQECFKCRKITKPGTKDWNEAPDCPLEHLLDRSKDGSKSEEKASKKRTGKKGDNEDAEDADESGVDMEDTNGQKPKKVTSRKAKVKKEVKEEDSTEEVDASELEARKNSRRSTRKKTVKQEVVNEDKTEDAEGSSFEIYMKPKKRTRRNTRVKKEMKKGQTEVEAVDVEMEDVSRRAVIDDDEMENEASVQVPAREVKEETGNKMVGEYYDPDETEEEVPAIEDDPDATEDEVPTAEYYDPDATEDEVVVCGDDADDPNATEDEVVVCGDDSDATEIEELQKDEHVEEEVGFWTESEDDDEDDDDYSI